MKFSDLRYKMTHWESWYYLTKYIPLFPFWAWYCLRSRSLWFFTSSNPTLTFGGFEGELKSEMYAQLPPEVIPHSILVSPSISQVELKESFIASGLKFPVAVKPDAGMMGFMFRKIEDTGHLEQYHQAMPCDYIIQEMIEYPLEVSVFYYRFPGAGRGTITGFIKKEFLSVKGDGKSTMEQLMDRYDRIRFRLDEVKKKHANHLNYVLENEEIYVLSDALNFSQGARIISLETEKDDRLLAVFDSLSHHAGKFYYGRYDIKCKSVEDLKNGVNYSILEYNGSGAEPHHVYGNGNTLLQAYRIILMHWKVLFHISRRNHRQGIKYWDFLKGYRFLRNAKKHFRALKHIDSQFPS